MHRRHFIKTGLACAVLLPGRLHQVLAGDASPARREELVHHADNQIRDAVRKAKDFEQDYIDDLYMSESQLAVMRSLHARLNRLQSVVGYANFNLINFDAARYYARHYSVIGELQQDETELMEALFSFNAQQYGFLGKKVSSQMTDTIKQSDVIKIRGSGHYLFRGEALSLYEGMQNRLGNDLILTSGIRSVVKQFQLFLNKADQCNGNLSRAARSLAPPGHSFHGVGDFDVGQRGLGAANFTNAFADTPLHQRLVELGLNAMRYPFANPYGVRHEPWHIKVVADV